MQFGKKYEKERKYIIDRNTVLKYAIVKTKTNKQKAKNKGIGLRYS